MTETRAKGRFLTFQRDGAIHHTPYYAHDEDECLWWLRTFEPLGYTLHSAKWVRDPVSPEDRATIEPHRRARMQRMLSHLS